MRGAGVSLRNPLVARWLLLLALPSWAFTRSQHAAACGVSAWEESREPTVTRNEQKEAKGRGHMRKDVQADIDELEWELLFEELADESNRNWGFKSSGRLCGGMNYPYFLILGWPHKEFLTLTANHILRISIRFNCWIGCPTFL